MSLIFADQNPVKSRFFSVMGRPKSGKTVFACTASEFAPEVLPANPPVYLKDTLVIQFDTNGVESAERLGLVPYLLDLSTVTEYKELIKAIRNAIQVAGDAVKNQGVKYIIVDTITTLDVMLSMYHQKFSSGQDVWKAIQRDHMDLAFGLKSIPATIICLFHLKYTHSLIEDKAGNYLKIEARTNANSLPGNNDYSLAITGSSANFYKGAGSGIFAIYKKIGNRKKGEKDEYVAITDNLHGFEAGSRFPELDAEEPANFRHILKKIEKKGVTNG